MPSTDRGGRPGVPTAMTTTFPNHVAAKVVVDGERGAPTAMTATFANRTEAQAGNCRPGSDDRL